MKLFKRSLSAFSRHRIHQLSDIREVSGSSRGNTLRSKPIGSPDGHSEAVVGDDTTEQIDRAQEISLDDISPPEDKGALGGMRSRAGSTIGLPVKAVPERRTSASLLGHSSTSRPPSEKKFPSRTLPTPSLTGLTVPSRGRSQSPVREALQLDAVSPEKLRRSPSKTFIRPAPPLEFLENGPFRHSRIDMSVQLPAPLFVGGGTIEGNINIAVDGGPLQKSKAKPIFISKLTIDVIGVEEVDDGRRWIFLSLATDVFNESHPPPVTLVNSHLPVSRSELFWTLKPARASVPFCVNLPLNVGPPSYSSKHAGIRYYVCPTLSIESGGKQSVLRQMCNVQMLTVYNPEKALASLPNPLLASDSISIQSGAEVQRIELTAGLHRQIWVNGAMIFVDIHVANKSSKIIKKIEVKLVKSILWYTHLAAGTGGKIANHLRLPKRTDKELVSTSTMKKSKDWTGILPNSSEIRTCDVSVPPGLVTISTGRFFEVRYFLNVTLTVSAFRAVAVELPVTIVHMNSLDILPNSLAQVAASIEAKRTRTVPVDRDHPRYPSFHQGQAFAAPRRQSLDRAREEGAGLKAEELNALTRDLDDSPRRYRYATGQGHERKVTVSTAMSGHSVPPGRPSGVDSSHHHHTRQPSCYHCHSEQDRCVATKASISSFAGPRLPRLQLSTSGLGFSDSEFEIAPNTPPRKVMLSESERQMILQQREEKLQRQQSRKSKYQQTLRRNTVNKERVPGSQSGYWGWKNVAVESKRTTTQPNSDDSRWAGVQRVHSARTERSEKRRSKPTRMRSKTNPERLGSRPPTHQRLEGSFDRSNRMPIPMRPSLDAARRMSYDQVSRNGKNPALRSEWL